MEENDIFSEALAPTDTLSAAQKEKLLAQYSLTKDKRLRHRKMKYLVASFVLILCLCCGVFFHQDIKAMLKQILNPLTEFFANYDLADEDAIKKEITYIGKSCTRQGIRITWDQVLVNPTTLAYQFTIHSNKKMVIKKASDWVSNKVYLNGQKIKSDLPENTCYEVDDQTLLCIGQVSMDSAIELTDSVSVRINITKLGFSDPVEDSWLFEASVPVVSSAEHSTSTLTKHSMTLDNGDTMRLDKVVNSSTGTNFYITYTYRSPLTEDDTLYLSGVDNKGDIFRTNTERSQLIDKKTNTYQTILTLEGGLGPHVTSLYMAPYRLYTSKKNVAFTQVGKHFSVRLS